MLKRNIRMRAVALLSVLFFVLISAQTNNETPEQKLVIYFSHQLDTLNEKLIAYQQATPIAKEQEIRQRFKDCRKYYKRVEFLIEYFYPAAAMRLNGPALLEADAAEPEEPQHPTGFQVLEEPVFEDITADSRLIIANEISNLINRVERVQQYNKDLQLEATEVFDALRLNIYRLMAKGISGFDSPLAFNSVAEASATLESMLEVFRYYNAPASLIELCRDAITYTSKNEDFNSFDRAVFITAYINPIMGQMHRLQVDRDIAFATQQRAVNTKAVDIFQADAFNMYYFAPTGTTSASPAMLELGRKLFNEPMLSANGKRACVSCHEPKRAFTDGLTLNASLSGERNLLRNTPTLINAALQPVQFYNSRIAFLEDQVHDVVSNTQEMGGDLNSILAGLKKNKEYQRLFEKAFISADSRWKKANIKIALAAYVRSLTSLNSRFDKYMRGDKAAMNTDEIVGFNLFMGKAKCGTCHYVPLFNGAVPPLYDKVESEVLGVPATNDTLHTLLDADSGKYHLYKMPHQVRSFKTPGLRNIAYTAPYMHNGVFKTLEEVIDFYNRGGGIGLGLEVENQTLPGDRLNLTEKEKKDLIAFLHTLNDTTFTVVQ